MSYQVSVDIEAPLERVWPILIDVERWPDWTPTVTLAERLDQGPLRCGSQVRLQQPRLPKLVWTVTAVQPEREFTWSTRAGGVTTRAGHVLRSGPHGGVTATLSIDRTGRLAWLLDLVYARLTRAYVNTEAQRLKRRCEASSAIAAAQQLR